MRLGFFAATLVVVPAVTLASDSATFPEATAMHASCVAGKFSLQTAWAYAAARDATFWTSLREGSAHVSDCYRKSLSAPWRVEDEKARASLHTQLTVSLGRLQEIDRKDKTYSTRVVRGTLDQVIESLDKSAQWILAFAPAQKPDPAPPAAPAPSQAPAAEAPSVPAGVAALVAGAGFASATAQPAAVGSGRGVDAKVIARWDAVPHQTVTGKATVGVVAFHVSGIDRVEFSVDGGPWAAARTMTLNPSTGVWEYCAQIDTTTMADGLAEVRAVAYPKVGVARVLAGAQDASDRALVSGEYSLMLNVNGKGTLPAAARWVSPTGNDATGDGTSAKPFQTISQAVAHLGAAADGATIHLAAGDYAYPSVTPAPSTSKQWLTIAAAAGLTPDQVRITSAPGSTGLATKLVRLKGLTLSGVELDDAGSYSRVWADGCVMEGSGPLDATRWFPLGQWTGGIYVTDCTLRKVKYPAYGQMLTRNTTITDCGGDSFREPSGLVANCEVRNLVNLDDTHNDVVQFWDPQPRSGFENVIFYGMRAVKNVNAQALFVQQYGNTVSYDNFAFVNYATYATIGAQWQNPGNHLLLWNSEFLSPPEALATNKGGFMFVDVNGRSTNVRNFDCRNSVFQRFNLLHTGAEPSLKDANVWADNNHYVDVLSHLAVAPGTNATTGGVLSALVTDAANGDLTPAASSVLRNRASTLLVPADAVSRTRTTPDAIGSFAPTK